MPDTQPIPDRISEVSRASIRALCHQIATAQGRDELIERELCTHMEDKLSAYLSGQEKLTEADALLLVKKHFGNPTVVASMLGRVHVRLSTGSMLRRLAAAAAASSAALLVVWSIGWVARLLAGDMIAPVPAASHLGLGPGALVHPIYGTLALIMTAFLLLRWDRLHSIGRSPWYQRWSAWAVASIVFASAAAFAAAQFFLTSRSAPVAEGTSLLLLLAHGWLWMWWLDRTAGLLSSMLIAAAGYAVFLGGLLLATPVWVQVIKSAIVTDSGYHYIHGWRRFWLFAQSPPGDVVEQALSGAALIGSCIFILYFGWVRWGYRLFLGGSACAVVGHASDRTTMSAA